MKKDKPKKQKLKVFSGEKYLEVLEQRMRGEVFLGGKTMNEPSNATEVQDIVNYCVRVYGHDTQSTTIPHIYSRTIYRMYELLGQLKQIIIDQKDLHGIVRNTTTAYGCWVGKEDRLIELADRKEREDAEQKG
tara:strand:+ start:549 stop:947 length:399 start_codon:yes stop_codon:yes gene_type:complete